MRGQKPINTHILCKVKGKNDLFYNPQLRTTMKKSTYINNNNCENYKFAWLKTKLTIRLTIVIPCITMYFYYFFLHIIFTCLVFVLQTPPKRLDCVGLEGLKEGPKLFLISLNGKTLFDESDSYYIMLTITTSTDPDNLFSFPTSVFIAGFCFEHCLLLHFCLIVESPSTSDATKRPREWKRTREFFQCHCLCMVRALLFSFFFSKLSLVLVFLILLFSILRISSSYGDSLWCTHSLV